MTDPGTELAPTIPAQPGALTLAAVRALGLDPLDPATQAMVWICRQYHLDPLFGHVIVLPSKSGPTPYLTHDGMVQLAHNSGDLDGIEVAMEWETDNGYGATVHVWSKRCTHPFTFNGGCGKSEPQAQRGYGAAMAVTRATRRALRRAFPIMAALDVDEGDDERDVSTAVRPGAHVVPDPAPAPTGGRAAPPPMDGAPGSGPRGDQGTAHAIVAGWGRDDQMRFLAAWDIETFGVPWPPDAVAAVLDGTALDALDGNDDTHDEATDEVPDTDGG